jgi:co-chaperonin GroES (HSP10)
MKASGIIEIECVRQQARNKDGTVIAIGPHEYDVDYKKTFPPDFNIGDRVYYSAWSGRETPCPEGYLLIRSGDLSLILDEDTSITWI